MSTGQALSAKDTLRKSPPFLPRRVAGAHLQSIVSVGCCLFALGGAPGAQAGGEACAQSAEVVPASLGEALLQMDRRKDQTSVVGTQNEVSEEDLQQKDLQYPCPQCAPTPCPAPPPPCAAPAPCPDPCCPTTTMTTTTCPKCPPCPKCPKIVIPRIPIMPKPVVKPKATRRRCYGLLQTSSRDSARSSVSHTQVQCPACAPTPCPAPPPPCPAPAPCAPCAAPCPSPPPPPPPCPACPICPACPPPPIPVPMPLPPAPAAPPRPAPAPMPVKPKASRRRCAGLLQTNSSGEPERDDHGKNDHVQSIDRSNGHSDGSKHDDGTGGGLSLGPHNNSDDVIDIHARAATMIQVQGSKARADAVAEAQHDMTCEECIHEECREELDHCADQDDCREYAECSKKANKECKTQCGGKKSNESFADAKSAITTPCQACVHANCKNELELCADKHDKQNCKEYKACSKQAKKECAEECGGFMIDAGHRNSCRRRYTC